MYKDDGLKGGHVIMLGAGCEEAALAALQAYPQGLQIGGASVRVCVTHGMGLRS
jgi:phosphoribosylformimino-5-aminoimidazole carboxamide ribotide isomerase